VHKVSPGKQLSVIRQYLGGVSYDDIAARCGVAKGTVANIVADLKAGRVPEVQTPAEQLDLLRELANDLQRSHLTAGQAVAGIAVLAHLKELGVEPADVGRWASMCREAAGQKAEAQDFVNAALAVHELKQRTGLSFQALESKAQSLGEEVARLEPLARESHERQGQIKGLEERRQALTNEIAELEKRQKPLREEVSQKERREAELSRRVRDLEGRAKAADERLAAAKAELKALEALGLSSKSLSEFVQAVARMSRRHGIAPEALRHRLFHDLEVLDEGLALESVFDTKRHELEEVKQTVARSQDERVALESALTELRKQRESLLAAIAEDKQYVRKEIRAIADVARDAVAKLREDASNEVSSALQEIQKLRNAAYELGQEVGRCQAMAEANRWIETFVAVSKGDVNVSLAQFRTLGLMTLRALSGWIEMNRSKAVGTYLLGTHLRSAIGELEQWRV